MIEFLSWFKESVSITFKFCRTCNISKLEIDASFDSREYDKRTMDEHMERLDHLKTLEGSRKKDYQKETGVMFASPLVVDLPDGSINKALHDVMHIILEVRANSELQYNSKSH